MKTTISPEFQARVDLFVEIADKISAEDWARSGYTHAMPPTHVATQISDKWIRVVSQDRDKEGKVLRGGSSYAFIAVQDNETKSLGKVKMGDIHKCAGFATPAKTARGNVFQDDFAKCMTRYGIVYLK